MQEDEIALCNACTDLVSLKKNEAFPLRLLTTKRAGEWVSVREFCVASGVKSGSLKADLFAAWLPDPMATEAAYAVIMFYDDESKWSLAAHYNRGRHLIAASSNQGLQLAGASSLASSQQAVPAPASNLTKR